MDRAFLASDCQKRPSIVPRLLYCYSAACLRVVRARRGRPNFHVLSRFRPETVRVKSTMTQTHTLAHTITHTHIQSQTHTHTHTQAFTRGGGGARAVNENGGIISLLWYVRRFFSGFPPPPHWIRPFRFGNEISRPRRSSYDSHWNTD